MIIWANLMGGLISCQFPYVGMIITAYFCSILQNLDKNGMVSFCKNAIEVFYPAYIFLQVLQGTTVDILKANYLIIVSHFLQMLFALLLSFGYIKLSRMDFRSRYTFIGIACFPDIKRLNYLMNHSFCYHLDNKYLSTAEETFCTQIKDPINKVYNNHLYDNSFVHLFFQGLIIWYIMDILIAREGQKTKVINKLNELKTLSEDPDRDKEAKEYDYITIEETIKLKEYFIEVEGIPGDKLEISEEFYEKLLPIYENFQMKKNPKKRKFWKFVLYSIFRAPIITLWGGFIGGLIYQFREWVLDPFTLIFLFFDTFNTIGNAHIICGMLSLGGNLNIDENIEYKSSPYRRRFTKMDYIAILLIRSLILPFLGVVYSLVMFTFIPNNRIYIFACFTQWVLPTSLDIMFITQSREINAKSVAIAISLQYLLMTFLSNYMILPAFLHVIGQLEGQPQ